MGFASQNLAPCVELRIGNAVPSGNAALFVPGWFASATIRRFSETLH